MNYSDRYTIGYTIFNKAHLMNRIIDGVKSIGDVNVIFLFDHCIDESLMILLRRRSELPLVKILVNRRFDLFEIFANNIILKHSKTPFIFLFQDDMIATGPGLLRLCDQIIMEQTNVGVIGFNNGYEMDKVDEYKDMVSSHVSTSKIKGTILQPENYIQRSYVNRGPLCFTRNALDKVGFLDENFYPLFWDDNDYCVRCQKAGLKNFVASGEIIMNPEWGATHVPGNTVPYQQFYRFNRWLFSRKWDMPIKSSVKGLSGSDVVVAAWWRLSRYRHKILNHWDIQELQ